MYIPCTQSSFANYFFTFLQVVKDVNDYLKEKGRAQLPADLAESLSEQVYYSNFYISTFYF